MKKKEKERQEETEGDQHRWWGTDSEERFPLSEKPIHGEEVSWGRRETFGGSEENEAACLWKAGQSKNCTHGLCHLPCAPHPELCVS